MSRRRRGASMFEVIRQQRLRVWFDWVWLAWEFSFRFQNHPPPPLATNPPGLAVRPYSSSSLCSANSFQPIQAVHCGCSALAFHLLGFCVDSFWIKRKNWVFVLKLHHFTPLISFSSMEVKSNRDFQIKLVLSDERCKWLQLKALMW